MKHHSRTVFAATMLAVTFSPLAVAQRTAGPYKDSRQTPDTAAARRALEVLDVINANDPQRTRAYVTNNFAPSFRDALPMDEHVATFASVYQTSHGFKRYGFRHYDTPRPDTEAVLIIRNELTDGWNAIVVEVDATAPHAIRGVQFAPARPPSDLTPEGRINETTLVAELRAFLDRVTAAEAFSGSVLLAKNGKVLFQGAYGVASRRFDVPNRIDTKFNLGSMNKMFTAVAIAQLVERGKLSFSDPISTFLSTDWLPREITEKITVEHLLTHTSGLGSYFSPAFMEASRTRFRTINDYKPLVNGETLSFDPGTQWAYSNTGFLLLGAIVESVTGGSYFDYVRKNVYVPVAMINTDAYAMDQPIPNLAIGYSKETTPVGNSYWTNNIFKHVVSGGPAGGGFSTVEDLFRFDQAMRSGKLVNKKTADLLWSVKPNSPDYGYGFGLRGAPGARIVGHNGGFPGISASLSMHLDTGFTVAVLSNYDEGAPIVLQKIEALLARLQ
ncbi:MAG: beta-lactamase family protein [Planctomycetes bacterium]|nr:beta-lactamase family protein [Planctomycetota bacterium]